MYPFSTKDFTRYILPHIHAHTHHTTQRLSTTSVPFTVLSMCHNPCNEDYLVVCGLKDCQLLVLNPSGQVTKRTILHPSVGNNGYIIKPLWIPGSKNSLVLVADSFVKIYDIQLDALSPKYYFLVLNGKIKDATVAVTEEVGGMYVRLFVLQLHS